MDSESAGYKLVSCRLWLRIVVVVAIGATAVVAAAAAAVIVATFTSGCVADIV